MIKANIPARISFYVPSYIDSRTIIDEAGAEELQINGDVIFSKIGSQKKKRIQTPYIADNEIEKIVEQICIEPKELDYALDLEIVDDMLTDEEDIDPFLMDAIEYAMNEREISQSMIQRILKVGYARAGRILDQMEERGIITGYEDGQSRKVLINNNDISITEDNKKVTNEVENNNNAIRNKSIVEDDESIFSKWWFWVFTIILILIIIKNI